MHAGGRRGTVYRATEAAGSRECGLIVCILIALLIMVVVITDIPSVWASIRGKPSYRGTTEDDTDSFTVYLPTDCILSESMTTPREHFVSRTTEL